MRVVIPDAFGNEWASTTRRPGLSTKARTPSADNPPSIDLPRPFERTEASTMPRLFIIPSHIVVIVIIMILYRFPLSVDVVAVLFHGPRLVWALEARRSHVQSRKTRVFLAEILSVLCFLACFELRAHSCDRRSSQIQISESADRDRWTQLRLCYVPTV